MWLKRFEIKFCDGVGTDRTLRIEYNDCGALSMPRSTVDFDTVRKLARELADVEESTTHGASSLRVRGKLMAWISPHKSSEPGSLALRISLEQREELISAAPDIYYVTDHYLNYPAVLVRLSRIQPNALKDLLGMSWSFMTTKSAGGKRTVKRRAAPRGR
jgi:hypothetical protein